MVQAGYPKRCGGVQNADGIPRMDLSCAASVPNVLDWSHRFPCRLRRFLLFFASIFRQLPPLHRLPPPLLLLHFRQLLANYQSLAYYIHLLHLYLATIRGNNISMAGFLIDRKDIPVVRLFY